MSPRPVPRFIDGPRGSLFAINWAPEEAARGTVICVPPFAEEMNRCRRTFTEFCIAAARRGWSVWQFDLHGTGDSAGDFAEADWAGWLEDLDAIAEKVFNDGARVLIGFRTGALLAAQWLAGRGRCDHLVLWQPVASGRQHLQQFLRLRIMASRFEGVNETLDDLFGELESRGETEIAGYRISHAVAEGMMDADLAAVIPAGASRVLMLETGPAAPERPTRPLAKVIDRWREARIGCAWQGLQDQQCWASQEIVISKRLAETTLDLLENDAMAGDRLQRQT